MLDPVNETLVTLVKANIPGDPHVATRWRWANKGVGRPRVRLESVRIGGVRYTSVEAVNRFIQRLNSPGDLPPAGPSNAATRAAEALAARGF